MPRHTVYKHPSYLAFAEERDARQRARFYELRLREERARAIAAKQTFLNGDAVRHG